MAVPDPSPAAPAAVTSAGAGEDLVFEEQVSHGGEDVGMVAGPFQLGDLVPDRADQRAGLGSVGQPGQRPSREL
jgi:hypothetical protein